MRFFKYNCPSLLCDNKEKERRWRPSVARHSHPPLVPIWTLSWEKKLSGRRVCVFFMTWVCVCEHNRGQCTSLEIGDTLILFVITCPLRRWDPRVPIPTQLHARTHTQTLTPSCVLSVSATDRESEANYMWELRRWKRDKDRAGVCACAYVAFVWVLIYFTCPCCCYVWVTQITVTCH